MNGYPFDQTNNPSDDGGNNDARNEDQDLLIPYSNHIHDFKALEIIYKKAMQGIDVTLFKETIWWVDHG